MTTELEQLPTTESGSVRKKDAMQWLEGLDDPNIDNDVHRELIAAITPAPTDHTGSKYPTPISQVRVTGHPRYITAVARLFKTFLAWETSATRVSINLQRIKDRDTGELTGNYALYLSAAVRGREGAMSTALLGAHRAEDRKLLEALEQAGA